MSTTKDSANIFRHAGYDEDYWNNYLTARPVYDEKFYQTVYDYHRARGNDFGTAHDAGTGPGQVAAELSKHFQQVIASDSNQTHLDVAQSRMDHARQSKVRLVQCSAEHLADHFRPESVDLVTAVECLPLLDVNTALRNFDTILKPGGTFAAWFYGRPLFAEAEYAPKCQSIYDSIVDTCFGKFAIKGGSPTHKAAWIKATTSLLSFLDNVDMTSTNTWTDIRRIKWNSNVKNGLSFYGPDACDFEVKLNSNIDRSKEEMTEVEDPTFWEKAWDLNDVKRFIMANMPFFDQNMFTDETVAKKFEDLAEAMGGYHAMRKITWPVVLILARKR